MSENRTRSEMMRGAYMTKSCLDCPFRKDISQDKHPDPRAMMYSEDNMKGKGRITNLYQCHNNHDRTCAGALSFSEGIGTGSPEHFEPDERCFTSQKELDEHYKHLYGSSPKMNFK